jgi:hypothetical protein
MRKFRNIGDEGGCVSFRLIALFILVLVAFAFSQGKNSSEEDSLKNELKVEVDKYLLDSNELFTEASGLTSLVDSAYPKNIEGLKNNHDIYRMIYPLLLNNKEMKDRIKRNRISLAKKKTAAWKLEGKDETASEDRFLHFKLFDGVVVTAVCDKFSNGLKSVVWSGHIKNLKTGIVRSVFDENFEMGLVHIEMNAIPLYIFSRLEKSGIYILTEKGFAQHEGPDCVIPNNEPIEIQ